MTYLSLPTVNKRHFVFFSFGVFILLFLFSSCKEKKGVVVNHNLKKFYFPYKQLNTPKMYAFESLTEDSNGNKEAPEYWIVNSFIHNGDTLIETKYFDYNLVLTQKTVERVISNGIVLQTSTIFQMDSLNSISSQQIINSDDIFAFEVEDENDLWISNTHWQNPLDTFSSYNFISNRHFNGYSEISFDGKNNNAISIESQNLIENINDGSLEILYKNEEIYIENVGLAYFRKEIAENNVREYKLAKIYNKEEFQQWFP